MPSNLAQSIMIKTLVTFCLFGIGYLGLYMYRKVMKSLILVYQMGNQVYLIIQLIYWYSHLNLFGKVTTKR
jgi:NADH:ubiquinone oxidoreductase subunit K